MSKSRIARISIIILIVSSMLGLSLRSALVARDADSIDMLEKRANGKESAQWKATLLLAKWWQSNKDADAQSKILDDLEKLAKANSKDEGLAQIVAMFPEQASANDELRGRAEN